jgi:hypothetical protein
LPQASWVTTSYGPCHCSAASSRHTISTLLYDAGQDMSMMQHTGGEKAQDVNVNDTKAIGLVVVVAHRGP